MKRFLKKTAFALIILFAVLSFYISAFGIEMQTNKKKDNIEYEVREMPLMSGWTLVFNDEVFFKGENNSVPIEQKNMNNYIIAGTCIVLVVYWVVLLFLFEKEDEYKEYKKIDDIDILNKYNPMIAGCLTENRQVLIRDVMALILNLIKKGNVNLEMVPNTESTKEDYIYMISENKEKKDGLDELENYVLWWIFGFYEEERVDLIKKLNDLAKRKDFLKHMNKLNSKAEKKLHSIGANIPRVPKELRIFNVALMLFTVLLSVVHIINNGVSIHIYQSTVFLFLLITAFVLLLIPITALVIHLILILIVLIKKLIKSSAEKYSGKHLVQMSALVIAFMCFILFVMYFILPNKYICLDIFMVGMSILIVKTDNLMTKHNKEILADYYALNEVKTKIEEYSLIKDEQINYIKIWDEYLIYAVAFGIPIPIVNKLKTQQKEDSDLRKLAECENLYYVCKAYLDIIVDMSYQTSKNRNILETLFE